MIGEQVGLAQRMESVAAPGGVIVGESTAHLVEGAVVLGEPGDGPHQGQGRAGLRPGASWGVQRKSDVMSVAAGEVQVWWGVSSELDT